MTRSIAESPAEAAEAAPVLRQDSAGIATLVLNRPRARNAMSKALMSALQAEIDAIADDPSVRVVVIGANGPAFCAGHDMRELRAAPTRHAHAATFAQSSALMLSIVRLPKPVIARVQGTATAAGCQLVATSDWTVNLNLRYPILASSGVAWHQFHTIREHRFLQLDDNEPTLVAPNQPDCARHLLFHVISQHTYGPIIQFWLGIIHIYHHM